MPDMVGCGTDPTGR